MPVRRQQNGRKAEVRTWVELVGLTRSAELIASTATIATSARYVSWVPIAAAAVQARLDLLPRRHRPKCRKLTGDCASVTIP